MPQACLKLSITSGDRSKQTSVGIPSRHLTRIVFQSPEALHLNLIASHALHISQGNIYTSGFTLEAHDILALMIPGTATLEVIHPETGLDLVLRGRTANQSQYDAIEALCKVDLLERAKDLANLLLGPPPTDYLNLVTVSL